MAATSKGFVYRPTVTRNRNGRKVKSRSRFYWCQYTDTQGSRVRKAVKLPTGEGVASKTVAMELLRKILQRVEREAVGVIDPHVEAAATPMRVVLARFVRHLRRQRRGGRSYILQVIQTLKWLIDHGPIDRLGEFREDRLDRALGILADKGRSPKTINTYRGCAFSLAEWALKIARVVDRNPVAAIQPRDVSADTRKVRRALTVEEARVLLGVAGPRRMFYAVALWSGLRVNEIRCLKWRDLHLDMDRPCLRLRAETTKSRRADELPLHPDLAEAIVAMRPDSAAPTDRLFSTTPVVLTFKADLKRAGILVEDDRGRTLDRHAMRTTFISWLGQVGVDARAQIALARHAPCGVTMRNYQDFGLFDLWSEIRKLPSMRADEANEQLATGTDGA